MPIFETNARTGECAVPGRYELVPITRNILLDAAALRARQRLRTPDAIQLATGVRAGATLAVTNDAAWRKVPLIETVILAELEA